MVSLRSAISDLERSEQLRLLTLDCYLSAIQNAAYYAVELEDALTTPHRKHLKTLAEGLEDGTPETLGESRSVFRAIVRDYRDQASRFLNQLREELTNTAGALHEILNSFNQTDGDHETRLRRALKTLRELSSAGNLESVRSELMGTTSEIEQSLEDLRKQHQLTVSQFLVEIRGLHQRIDALENAAALDVLSQLYNRREMEKRILDAQEGASLLLIRAHGIRRAEQEFQGSITRELTGAFTKRLRNTLTPSAVLGRWGDEEFIAIGPQQKSEALTAAKWITERLSGTYACLQGGKTVRPTVKVDVMVVDRPPGGNADQALAQVREYLGE